MIVSSGDVGHSLPINGHECLTKVSEGKKAHIAINKKALFINKQPIKLNLTIVIKGIWVEGGGSQEQE